VLANDGREFYSINGSGKPHICEHKSNVCRPLLQDGKSRFGALAFDDCEFSFLQKRTGKGTLERFVLDH
jgi:hypothetical protein